MIVIPIPSDCEVLRDGFLGQPVNALTSLAFVVVGMVLLRSRPVLGVLACLVGVGSFLFHGPMPAWAEWAHDVSLTLLAIGLVLEQRPRLVALSAVVLGAGLAVFLEAAELVTLTIAAVAAAVLTTRIMPNPSRSQRAAIGLLAAGALIALLSRTGGPLCAPSSVVLGHGIWHLMGAAALWVWARSEEYAAAEGVRP
jgi:hypothetical protein